jgi:hypothetical protein
MMTAPETPGPASENLQGRKSREGIRAVARSRSTGIRFNFAQGVFGVLTGASAAVGAGIFGFVAQHFGDATALFSMAAGIALGMVALYLFLPETKPKFSDAEAAAKSAHHRAR